MYITGEKDYDLWNNLKKDIESRERTFYVKPREVVWVNLGENIGDEENGKGKNFQRPMLVVRVFNKSIFLAIPLSTKIKESNRYYIPLRVTSKSEDGIFHIDMRSAMISHIRLIDTKRITGHVGYAHIDDFEQTKIATRAIV